MEDTMHTLKTAEDLPRPEIARDELVLSSQKKRLFQVDLFKTWMILLVIMDHSTTHGFLAPYGSIFWERIAIPGFMVILGFNAYNSFEKQEWSKLRHLYSKVYFQKKIERYVLPYLGLYCIHGIIRLILYIFSINVEPVPYYENNIYMWLGYTPFYGPGMWFMPVLLGSIFLMPLLYFLFKKRPYGILFGGILIEALLQFILFLVFLYDYSTYIDYSLASQLVITSFGFIITGSILGMWIARNPKLDAIHNMILYPILLINLIYMLFYFKRIINPVYYPFYYRGFDPTAPIIFPFISGDYHFLTFGFTAMIFLVFLEVIPSFTKSNIRPLIEKISNSTYHILLVQMFYFSILYHFTNLEMLELFDHAPWNYFWYYPLNVGITFLLGIKWKELEMILYEKLNSPRNHTLKMAILICGMVLLIGWFCISIYLFVSLILLRIPELVQALFNLISELSQSM